MLTLRCGLSDRGALFLLSHSSSSLTALALAAIGVVYGDIGTSVLYAVKEVFGSGHVDFTPANGPRSLRGQSTVITAVVAGHGAPGVATAVKVQGPSPRSLPAGPGPEV